MSQILINAYLADLDRIKRISGAMTEEVIREAFKDLLKAWAKSANLVFLAEHWMESPQKTRVKPDGTILHDLRVPLGFWEAKDTADDLDTEIAKKFRKGYPQENIIFENSHIAVLIQNRVEVMRCSMTDTQDLDRLLTRFFAYERPEIEEFRRAVTQFQTDLPAILEGLRDRIDTAYKTNTRFQVTANAFLAHAKETINPTLAEADIREMLIQHILTEEIFTQVFDGGQFHRENNIARELFKLEEAFFTGAVKWETLKAMGPYYAAIRKNAAQITGHTEKQAFLKVIYEGFYKVYNPKAADRLGVVYTPGEIVRFMIEGADWLCHKHFGKNLIDHGVEILDPATGTGTYICELIDYFRGQPEKLHRKYKEELHANEVAILPYYVANLNIEATYASVSGQYAEFPNLCFVDTLDNVGGLGVRADQTPDMFASITDENVERVKRQNRRKISVVIGNPPYNAWQEDYNQRNPNRPYKKIDQRIKETYIRKGEAQNQNSVYDMYARFFRWAADRVHDDGIICFITGRKPFSKGSYDGFRADLLDEFNEVYVVDLGGDVVDNPKLSGTKHNVFGIKTGVAISFLVKRKGQIGCRIYYTRRPEDDTADEKLSWLSSNKASSLLFDRIEPEKGNIWLEKTENKWDDLIPIASKDVKARKRGYTDQAVFRLFSNGIQTKKDEWIYGFDKQGIEIRTSWFFDQLKLLRTGGQPEMAVKWDREIERKFNTGGLKNQNTTAVRRASFRPFVKKFLYYDPDLISISFQTNQIAPYGSNEPPGPIIGFHGMHSTQPFTVLSALPPFDICMLKTGNGSTFGLPRHRFSASGEKTDNITNWAVVQFQKHYGPKLKITKDDIFHYTYAVLHDPIYRETYAINLKREFPRLPFYPDFPQWVAWGKHLMDLHIGYETVAPWPLSRHDIPDTKARAAGIPPKTALKALPEAGSVVVDGETTLSDIPAVAWSYRLGNRSGIEWVLDQYKEKTPKDPTIRAKFNTYRFADYKDHVIDLLGRVTRVSVETMEIVTAMRSAKR